MVRLYAPSQISSCNRCKACHPVHSTCTCVRDRHVRPRQSVVASLSDLSRKAVRRESRRDGGRGQGRWSDGTAHGGGQRRSERISANRVSRLGRDGFALKVLPTYGIYVKVDLRSLGPTSENRRERMRMRRPRCVSARAPPQRARTLLTVHVVKL